MKECEMMKTIQYYLKNASRENLLGSLAYDLLRDPLALLEMKDHTVAEIEEAYKAHMGKLIDHLLSLQAEPSDHMVFYLSDAKSHDDRTGKTLDLVDLNQIREDIHATGYGFEFTRWQESLGYLVADNKLTQDYLVDLLTQYLREITFFGSDPEAHEKKVEEVLDELDKSMEEFKAGNVGVSLEELDRELGFPVDEKDEVQDTLRSEVIKAEMEYNRYCQFRERKRILESLGEKVSVPFTMPENVAAPDDHRSDA